MSTLTATVPMTTAVPQHTGGRLSDFTDTLRMEWIKLRSVRSTYWTLLALVGGIIAIGLLISVTTVGRWGQTTAIERAAFDPTFRSLTGIFLGQLAIGVLGVLVITAEYSTGMIRSTFASVPQRASVLAAKALTFAGVALVVGTAACLAAFLGGQAIFAGKGIGVSLGAAGELRAVLGGGVFLALLGLFALGIGGIVRHTAGAIAAFVGIILVAPALVAALPSPWSSNIAKFLPGNAGQSLISVHASSGQLGPWTALAVLGAWVALSLGTAAALIRRRDA
jgi:ABC-type transport system involved in multi-copper enzyme maturation permease subunit